MSLQRFMPMNIHPLLKIQGFFLKAGVTEQLVQGGLPASWADSEGAKHIPAQEERGSQSIATHHPHYLQGLLPLCRCVSLQLLGTAS